MDDIIEALRLLKKYASHTTASGDKLITANDITCAIADLESLQAERHHHEERLRDIAAELCDPNA